MSAYSNLGIGVGYIYVTDTDGTIIHYTVPNDKQGARMVKMLGLQASNLATNLSAYGSFEVQAPTGSGDITEVNVNGVNQITNNISFTVVSTAASLATDIATEVNSTTPASGANYSAIAIDDVVYLVAPASSGDSVNGQVISVSISANLTVDDVTDIDYGSDSNTTSYNTSFGYRFYLEATADADPAAKGGSATEITDFLCRTLDAGIPIVTATIDTGAITIERIAPIQYVVIDTEGAAASDDLATILPVNFATGDQIIIVGTNASRVVTLNNTGNIVTQGAVSFSTGNYANTITLGKQGNSWYEVSKSTTAVPTAAQFRTANFPLLSTSGYGSAALTAADNTTVTLTANTDKQKQVITGTVTLSTGNYTVAVSTTNAKAGDTFYIEYNALVTVGSYDVVIGGITLTDADALTGGILVEAYYSGSAWEYSVYKDYYQSAKVQTANIATDAVTVANVETSLKTETLIIPVSWDAGESAENRIRMGYAGSVVKITAFVTKAITDDATVTAKDTNGVILTGGTITFNSGDPIDTGVTVTPSANNTFIKDDFLSFLTQTSTLGGGKALLSIEILRA